jgi:diguanylate cyclase (GGDEF)-like protein
MALALVVGVVGLAVGFVLGVRHGRGPRTAPGGPTPLRRASDLAARDRTQEALLAAFRPDEVPEPADVLLNDQRILSGALREIRHRRGAVSAVLWVVDPFRGGEAIPVAWSSVLTGDDAAHDAFRVDASSRTVIEWSAQEEQLGFDGGSDTPRLAVAPLRAGVDRAALSLHFDDGALVTREAMREWLPQHAAMMQTWYDLVRTRSESSRANFKLRGLIRTAGTLQAARDPLELERTLVVDSLTVVGATWAVLIRWDERGGEGTVRAATADAVALGVEFEGFRVRAESIAGQVCVEGRPQVFTDARSLVRGPDQVFGSDAQLGEVGALLAVPLLRGDHERPIGALVCGHRDVNALSATEARNAKNLGVIAAGALETAWAMDDARRNARTDPLTGLANRRGFNERFEQVVSETDRYGGTAALIMVDLDFFKKVNDTYGHDAGDKVLVAVANVLREGRRTVDLAARLGGEELAVLLPQTDAGGAREVAERLRQRIEALRISAPPSEFRVTASFGIGEYGARSGVPKQVLDHADRALYEAKRNGRNRVEVVT